MGFLGDLKKGLIDTGKGISAEIARQQDIRRQKLQVLNQLDMCQLKKICKNFGIGQPCDYDQAAYMLNGRRVKITLTRDHYSNYIIGHMTLEQIKGIGEKLGINIPENPLKVIKPVIISEPEETIESVSSKSESKTVNPENIQQRKVNKEEEKLKEIMKQIEVFRPNKVFNKESEYENTLYTRLEVFFPNIEQQVPFANSRIDIKIDGFGIEIKNHPDQNEINRLVGQLLSYRKYFKHIIVVIFNPKDMKSIKYLKEQIKEFSLAVSVIVK